METEEIRFRVSLEKCQGLSIPDRACGCSICKHQCLELDASCNQEPEQGDQRSRSVVLQHSESSVKV